jgi:pyrimidine-nucleoside phosphorylase
MNPAELIRKKRNGDALSRAELEFLITGYLAGTVEEYQMSAFLMSVYFKGMSFEEISMLTDLMIHSGSVADLSSVAGIKVDKHSTGGVGDKASLILAPMVAACGVPVPMISGRGLGHTGGTLDKLESIPGFRTDLSLQEYSSVLKEIGVVMTGQTKEIAPADKRLYALRDVTGTVESIPLIAGSIMSKKIAEGTDALVLDVKTGRGAFMQSKEDAIRLTETLIAVGNMFGKKTIGFLTDMNQPLGYAVGNWLEVVECIECMQGKNVPDLMELTYVLGGAMVMLGGKATTLKEGIQRCREAVASGRTWERFRKLVARQGGNLAVIDNPKTYRTPKHSVDLHSSTSGDVENIDALEVGFAAIMLGAGRMKIEDRIDPTSGILLRRKVGDSVNAGDVLATICTENEKIIEQACHRIERAISVATEPAAQPPLIHAMIDERGVHPWHGLDENT